MTAKTPTPVRHALTVLAGAGTLAALAACSSTATAGSDSAESTAPSSAAATPSSSEAAPETEASSAPAADASPYADGTYEADGSYTSPGGNESVGVSLTLEGGTVAAVTVTPESENPTGQQYQERFAGGISGEIVGKPLDELEVTKVAGSSLTSGGFNDAVETIKADAAA